MPGQSKQIKKATDKFKKDRSPATPPRMPGKAVIRNEMTDKRYNQGRTKMMDPKSFQFMRMDMDQEKNPGRERSASAKKAKKKRSKA